MCVCVCVCIYVPVCVSAVCMFVRACVCVLQECEDTGDCTRRSVRDSGYDCWDSERSDSLSPPRHARDDSLDRWDPHTHPHTCTYTLTQTHTHIHTHAHTHWHKHTSTRMHRHTDTNTSTLMLNESKCNIVFTILDWQLGFFWLTFPTQPFSWCCKSWQQWW